MPRQSPSIAIRLCACRWNLWEVGINIVHTGTTSHRDQKELVNLDHLLQHSRRWSVKHEY